MPRNNPYGYRSSSGPAAYMPVDWERIQNPTPMLDWQAIAANPQQSSYAGLQQALAPKPQFDYANTSFNADAAAVNPNLSDETRALAARVLAQRAAAAQPAATSAAGPAAPPAQAAPAVGNDFFQAALQQHPEYIQRAMEYQQYSHDRLREMDEERKRAFELAMEQAAVPPEQRQRMAGELYNQLKPRQYYAAQGAVDMTNPMLTLGRPDGTIYDVPNPAYRRGNDLGPMPQAQPDHALASSIAAGNSGAPNLIDLLAAYTGSKQADTGEMGVVETGRANVAREGLQSRELDEIGRANRASEGFEERRIDLESERVGLASSQMQLEWDKFDHGKVMDDKEFNLKLDNFVEQKRRAMKQENLSEREMDLAEKTFREQARRNRALELQAGRELDETSRHNMASEANDAAAIAGKFSEGRQETVQETAKGITGLLDAYTPSWGERQAYGFPQHPKLEAMQTHLLKALKSNTIEPDVFQETIRQLRSRLATDPTLQKALDSNQGFRLSPLHYILQGNWDPYSQTMEEYVKSRRAQ